MDLLKLLKQPSFIFRLVELLFAVIATGLTGQNEFIFLNTIHQLGFVFLVTRGFVLILAMQILERLIEETSSKKMAMLWSFVGAVLWFSVGSLIVRNYTEVNNFFTITPPREIKVTLERFLAAGIFAFLNGSVFMADLGTTEKFERRAGEFSSDKRVTNLP